MDLDELKQKWDWVHLENSEIDWLIEQAEKVNRYEKALKEIVNTQIDQWLKYNEKHGGQISFQEFLKEIARNALEG